LSKLILKTVMMHTENN